MSTFCGLISEIPGISVDRFDEPNLSSSVFFLSHYHKDHMVGLNHEFFEELKNAGKYLYCSPFSKMALSTRGFFQIHNVIEIDVNDPTYVEFKTPSGDICTIRVISIPAGHCPGSVMFLFEKDSTSILYTGDFRINPKDFQKLKFLHYEKCSTLIPRKLDKIYLDTTFLSRDYLHFPTREESSSKICQEASKWICSDPKNVVLLKCSANYGSEYLFMELSKQLNLKVHVADSVFATLCAIREISEHVTNDPHSTRLHACTVKSSRARLRCTPGIDETNILTVIPSAMRWRGKNTSAVGEWDRSDKAGKTLNVCYSMHSSFNELHAFVQYFKPTEIFPCVDHDDQKQQTDSLLREILRSPRQLDEHDCTFPIPKKKRIRVSFKPMYFSDDSDSS